MFHKEILKKTKILYNNNGGNSIEINELIKTLKKFKKTGVDEVVLNGKEFEFTKLSHTALTILEKTNKEKEE